MVSIRKTARIPDGACRGGQEFSIGGFDDDSTYEDYSCVVAFTGHYDGDRAAISVGGYLCGGCFWTNHRSEACKTEVAVDQMFTPEELAALTPLEIEDRMNRLLVPDLRHVYRHQPLLHLR